MAGEKVSAANDRQRRRWSFAECIFDEANWTLTVDGRRVAVEAKPLELLRELLLHAGDLVAKDQLMDKIWPDVEVVEASLPTAIGKLRRALNDDRRDRPIIETVPRRGYRLTVPVEVEELRDWAEPQAAAAADAAGEQVARGRARRATDRGPNRASGPGWLLGAGLALVAVLVAVTLGTTKTASSGNHVAPRTYTRADAFTALRKIDVDTLERMIAAGWDPNRSLDTDGNGAIGILLGNCEWDPGHDQRRMLLAARTLVDGGARIADRNAWGDTPYSIAKADRYCGPDHPVTKMIHMFCYEGGNPIGDRCLADYKRDASGKIVRQKPQPAK
jgi:DNA-binding winged helix-turn-helix (wHTH) protein